MSDIIQQLKDMEAKIRKYEVMKEKYIGIADRITKISNELKQLSIEINPFINDSRLSDGVGTRGIRISSVRQKILELLEKEDKSFENAEIAALINKVPTQTNKQLRILIEEGKVEKSSTRPAKYFLRSRGDVELKEALAEMKAGIKVSNF